MHPDQLVLDRIRNILEQQGLVWNEKKMFGGFCFMVNDKMCFGTYKKGLMVRVDPIEIDTLVQRKGAEQLIHNGRPMKGYAWVSPDGFDDANDLEFWIVKCLEFNPKAKSSKSKK